MRQIEKVIENIIKITPPDHKMVPKLKAAIEAADACKSDHHRAGLWPRVRGILIDGIGPMSKDGGWKMEVWVVFYGVEIG